MQIDKSTIWHDRSPLVMLKLGVWSKQSRVAGGGTHKGCHQLSSCKQSNTKQHLSEKHKLAVLYAKCAGRCHVTSKMQVMFSNAVFTLSKPTSVEFPAILPLRMIWPRGKLVDEITHVVVRPKFVL